MLKAIVILETIFPNGHLDTSRENLQIIEQYLTD